MMPTNWRERIKVHPAADLLPRLADTAPDELRELADDIRENGIQQGVILWTPKQYPPKGIIEPKDYAKAEICLLDGRNRLDAIELAYANDPEKLDQAVADALWIAPHYKGGAVLLGSGEVEDPWAYVISANLKRRHLTVDDRKRIAVELLKAKPERSDRATARIARVSHPTVAAIRRELEGSGDVERISTRTDAAGRQQPASKPPKPQSVEAWRRDMREQQAGEVEGRSAAPVPAPSDAGRVQNAILQAYVALKATDKADLRAGCRGLDTDQIALAVDHIDGCLARLRKLQMALRGDE
jgi:hypothetical protein